jgi:hypothetical protein
VVEVFALEAPDPLLAEPVVEVFADDVPDEGWLVAEVEEEVVVLAWEPDEVSAVWVGLTVDVGLVVMDDVVVWSCDPVVFAGVEECVGSVGVVHQFVEKEFVVCPVVCEAEIEIGGAIAAGWVLADVFEVLWVLDAPPLTDGEMLNTGWMLIAGATVIIGEAVAMARALAWPCRLPPPLPLWEVCPWWPVVPVEVCVWLADVPVEVCDWFADVLWTCAAWWNEWWP